MLSCQKCGYENELGRIFCHQCGTKLDLSQIKAPGQGGKKLKRRGQGGVGKLVKRSIDFVVLALLVWAVYLLVQVPADTIPKPTDKELIAAESRRLAFDALVNRKQAGTLEVTPAEFNAFLNSLTMNAPKGEGAALTPESVRAEFGQGVVTVVFRGQIQAVGIDKKLVLSYTGIPAIKGGHFEFTPVAGVIGGLPIHPWLVENTPLFKGYFGSLFGKLNEEQQALERLSRIDVTPTRATLIYQPAK